MILMKLEFFPQIFEKSWKIKFHENPSSGSRVVSRGQRTDGRKDMTKVAAAFRSFVKAPKMEAVGSSKILQIDTRLLGVTFHKKYKLNCDGLENIKNR